MPAVKRVSPVRWPVRWTPSLTEVLEWRYKAIQRSGASHE
ncbi:GpE family phage tail protein [Escherichia coli]|nr:GpE family phage tail protein [Escherichia coli]